MTAKLGKPQWMGGNYGTFSPGAQQMMDPLKASSPFASGPRIPSVGNFAPPPPDIGGGMNMEEASPVPEQRRGILPAIGDALKEYGPLAIAGLSAYEGFQQNRKSEEMMKRAIAEQEAKKAMLAEGRARRDELSVANLSQNYSDPGNPYAARRRRIPAVGGA